MIIKLLIDGGKMTPGPAVAQQLGPMGINMGKVISEVNEATKEFTGMKVPVELDIDEKTKEFTVKTSSPPTSELLKKEINLEKGTADHKAQKVGNVSIEDIIKVTNVKYSGMLEKEFKSAVKSVLGTCASIGVLAENKDANILIQDVNAGKFDKEIDGKLTETTPEKRKKLDSHFKEVVEEQERIIAEQKAAEEEAAKEAEAAKAAEGAEGEVPAEGEEGEVPAEGAEAEAGAEGEAKPEAEKPAEESK
jgi:large subunit ribosomal protein L11|tara:strand:- start:633 stop:1379 length:747 start_codon:yes stop_codon:yes gene_type:complete